MISHRKTIFISDLHLDETRQDMTQRFFDCLKQLDSSVDALYILGDLFEAWIGDDNQTPFYHAVTHALKAVIAKGIPVYILHGNRDFLIGKRFLRDSGCVLLPDESIVLLYHTPVLLMHGDTLCTHDLVYLRSRKKLRNRWIQTLFLLLPLSLRQYVANKMRAASTRHTQSSTMEMMDVTQTEVENRMQTHHIKFLIHGHTHRPAIHSFSLQGDEATRIVLGAWHTQGNMLLWEETGEKKLVNF